MMMVALALVDEPELAMRQTFDPEKLAELAESIKQMGILQNLVLIRNGDRYRVAAGHRRSVAARMAGELDVPAMVFPDGTSEEEAMKVAENGMREDVNPVDEAVYFWALFESRCGHDIDRVAALVGRKREYVEGRIELLQGDEEVLAELQAGRITIGVARELNRCSEDTMRKVGLEWAIKGGATVSVMKHWRLEQEDFIRRGVDGAQGELQPGAPLNAVPTGPDPMTCYCCGRAHELHEIRWLPVHTFCQKAILDPLMQKE